MSLQFGKHSRYPTTPFNEGIVDYYSERDKRKNPLRIQWCIDRIREAESHA